MTKEQKEHLNNLLLELSMDAGNNLLRSGEYMSDRIRAIQDWINTQ